VPRVRKQCARAPTKEKSERASRANLICVRAGRGQMMQRTKEKQQNGLVHNEMCVGPLHQDLTSSFISFVPCRVCAEVNTFIIDAFWQQIAARRLKFAKCQRYFNELLVKNALALSLE
jgi:hypothetical protein